MLNSVCLVAAIDALLPFYRIDCNSFVLDVRSGFVKLCRASGDAPRMADSSSTREAVRWTQKPRFVLTRLLLFDFLSFPLPSFRPYSHPNTHIVPPFKRFLLLHQRLFSNSSIYINSLSQSAVFPTRSHTPLPLGQASCS